MTEILNGQVAETEDECRRAAETGDIDASYNLGVLLEGQGQRSEAAKWYWRAARAGDVDSMFNLAGVLQDLGKTAEAQEWYRQAADAGDLDAETNLGVLRGRDGHPSAGGGPSAATPTTNGSEGVAQPGLSEPTQPVASVPASPPPPVPPVAREPAQWGQPPVSRSKPKHPGRILRRVLIGWNVLAVIWLIAGIINVVAQSHSATANCSSDFQQACQSAYNVGALVGVGIVVFFWVAGDVILGVLYLVRSRSERR